MGAVIYWRIYFLILLIETQGKPAFLTSFSLGVSSLAYTQPPFGAIVFLGLAAFLALAVFFGGILNISLCCMFVCEVRINVSCQQVVSAI